MTDQLTVKMNADVNLISIDAPTERVIEIALTTPLPVSASKRMPLNLGLVLDRSGSMQGEKIAQARQTLKRIVEQMSDGDVVSVVAFDDTVRTVADRTHINSETRDALCRDIDHIHAGGSTNLTDGWLTGCNCVAEGPSTDHVRRTLLVSDGLANVGIVHNDEIWQHAAALFERGIPTSTFGVGLGFNEHLLEGMANRGGGNFAYIESAAVIDQVIMQEFKDLVAVTARGVKVEINLPVGVRAEIPGEWRMEQEPRKITVFLSDLPANRTTNLFLKLITPPGDGQLVLNTVVTYENESKKKRTVVEEFTFQYAIEEKVSAAKKDQDLVRRFAAVIAGQQMNEALKLERAGRRRESKEVMDQMLSRYGADMPAPTSARYREVASRIERGLEEPERKNLSMDSYLLKKHRHEDER